MSFQKVPAPRPASTTDPFGIVPAPAALTPGEGTTAVVDGARIVADPTLRAAARWWRRVTEDAFGLDLVPADPSAPGPAGSAAPARLDASEIPTVVMFALDDDLPPSGYRLTVEGGGGPGGPRAHPRAPPPPPPRPPPPPPAPVRRP
ncbi:glycoside hydrolase family 20 zincin-like fold domain-containing protein, partial [Cellulosimicrobium cellulans]|uniref:glycoside hydrolase family 20 zincin-like fold domain-containing protein n=1 Tax=Cellulosimicrobium cellulans TaxID=1710 RepID=UPI0036467E5A